MLEVCLIEIYESVGTVPQSGGKAAGKRGDVHALPCPHYGLNQWRIVYVAGYEVDGVQRVSPSIFHHIDANIDVDGFGLGVSLLLLEDARYESKLYGWIDIVVAQWLGYKACYLFTQGVCFIGWAWERGVEMHAE